MSDVPTGSAGRGVAGRTMRGQGLASRLLAVVLLASCSGTESRSGGEATGSGEWVQALLDRVETAEAEPDAAVGHPLVRTVRVGGEERAAVQVHAPRVVAVRDVLVPREGRMRFGVGVADHPDLGAGDGVEFRVAVVAGGAREEVWRRHLDPGHRPEDRGWLDAEVSLERWSGAEVDLVLEVSVGGNRRFDRAAWSRLVVAGETGEPGLPAIERSVQLRRLSTDDSAPVTVAPGSELAISGMVMRSRDMPNDLEPVTYRVTIEGDPVWERTVSTRPRRNGFTETIPLNRWSGRDVRIGFEIDVPKTGQPHLEASWGHRALVARETIRRQPAARRPNVLLVVVDTLRADHLSAYGYERETSPNLDGVAARGTTFWNAISQSSWTMPATASLLTGLYPTEHGVTDGQAVPLEIDTLAERMQERGLTTLGISANPLVGEPEGFAQGMERFVHIPWARAEAVNDLFFQMVREYSGSQWFAYLHYIDPHDPYAAPEPHGSRFLRPGEESRFADPSEFRKLADAVNFEEGVASWDDGDVEYLEAAYDGEIHYWDGEFAKLRDRLRELGMLDDTILVVTSDHGEEFLEHGRLKHGLHLYEESVRVPLIVHGPGVPVARHDEPVETRRLFDLCLALAEAPGDAGSANPEDLLRARRNVVFMHTDHGRISGRPGRVALAAVRDERWKLIEYPVVQRRELYDLAGDPGETADAALERAAVAEARLRLLHAWGQATAANAGPGARPDHEILEEMRALGYIQ